MPAPGLGHETHERPGRDLRPPTRLGGVRPRVPERPRRKRSGPGSGPGRVLGRIRVLVRVLGLVLPPPRAAASFAALRGRGCRGRGREPALDENHGRGRPPPVRLGGLRADELPREDDVRAVPRAGGGPRASARVRVAAETVVFFIRRRFTRRRSRRAPVAAPRPPRVRDGVAPEIVQERVRVAARTVRIAAVVVVIGRSVRAADAAEHEHLAAARAPGSRHVRRRRALPPARPRRVLEAHPSRRLRIRRPFPRVFVFGGVGASSRGQPRASEARVAPWVREPPRGVEVPPGPPGGHGGGGVELEHRDVVQVAPARVPTPEHEHLGGAHRARRVAAAGRRRGARGAERAPAQIRVHQKRVVQGRALAQLCRG